MPLPLLPLGEARDRLLALVPRLDAEATLIEDALGRALAKDVRALRTVPPWDNSAMDGYAVRSADSMEPGTTLRVAQTIHAGERSTRLLQPGEAARIMTGAPLPPGADAVIMQEKTARTEAMVTLQEAVRTGAHVRSAGEDAKAGEVLLPAGTVLGIPEAGLLWGQGLTHVPVPRRARVAILSTGDELCDVRDAEAHPDRLVDTNGPSLALAVRRAGGEVRLLGIAKDTPESVAEHLARADDADVVITSAGMSVGERDHVREVLERSGVALSFWKAAIKPGKPLCAGVRGRTLFVGLPGNPTSSLVTFELFVRPALLKLAGRADVTPPRVAGRTDVALEKAAGLAHFIRVTTEWRDGMLWARPLVSQTSGALRSAAKATHLLHFPTELTRLGVGAPVELLPLSWVG